jgi:hypothetical protein
VALAVVCGAAAASMAAIFGRGSGVNVRSLPVDGLLAWLALTIWILGLQSLVVVYGGGTWFGDWHEHYERAVFFLDHLPPETKFLNGYWSLAARGPMFNAAAAVPMAAFGRAFADYQSIATVLNTFAMIPMALLLRDMGRLSQRAALFWSAVLFGLAPFAVQQEMFTATKFFTLAFVLGGIHVYRIGLKENRPWVASGSFAIFAAGVLAHYLVLPFAAFFAIHFIFSAIRRHWNWRFVAGSGLASALLMASWFAYLVSTFGLSTTLTANSTLGDYGRGSPGPYGVPASRAVVFLGNLVTTTIPYSWRHEFSGIGRAPRHVQMDARAGAAVAPAPAELNRKTEWFSSLADNTGSILGTLGFAGSAGAVLAAIMAIRRRRPAAAGDPPREVPGPLFWMMFFGVGMPLCILASPQYAPNGLAHVNLQPYAAIAAVLLFRHLRTSPNWTKGVLVAVFLVESALSTGTRVYLQARRVPLVLRDRRPMATAKLDVDPIHVSNYMLKLETNTEFISDRLGELNAPFTMITTAISMALLLTTATMPSSGDAG